MDTRAAVDEFISMMRLGTAALKQVVSKDHQLAPELEPDINEILYLVDRLDELAGQFVDKTRAKALQSNSP